MVVVVAVIRDLEGDDMVAVEGKTAETSQSQEEGGTYLQRLLQHYLALVLASATGLQQGEGG